MRITVNFVVVIAIVLVATTSVIHAADADNEKLVGEVSCYVPNLLMICDVTVHYRLYLFI
jgi:hypothetical protein